MSRKSAARSDSNQDTTNSDKSESKRAKIRSDGDDPTSTNKTHAELVPTEYSR